MNHIPCGHLVEHHDGGTCMIGRSFPSECGGCAAYIPGLTEQERTRCEVWQQTNCGLRRVNHERITTD